MYCRISISHFASTKSWALWITINPLIEGSGCFSSSWNWMFTGQAARIAWKNIIVTLVPKILIEILVCSSTSLNIHNFCMAINIETSSSSGSSPKCSLGHLLMIIIVWLFICVPLLAFSIFSMLYSSILYQSHFLTSPKLVYIRTTVRIWWSNNVSIWCTVLGNYNGLSH